MIELKHLAVSADSVDGIAASSTDELLKLGAAGVFIIVLLIAVVVLYRKNERIQEQRLIEAKETRDNIGETMVKIGSQQEKIYDILLSDKKGR